MANVLIGTPIYSDVGVLQTPTFDASGTWEAGNPLTNLQDRRLWTIARSSSAAEIDTRLGIDLGQDRAVRLVAIPKHTLSSAAKWRVTGRKSTDLFSYIAGEDIAARGGVFARTGTATYVDRAGVLRTAADGVPRDGHWLNGERTLLLEPARTNLCIRSEEFGDASWTKYAGLTVTSNATIAPDGTLTADLLVGDGSASGQAVVRTVTFTGDAEKCYSVYLKEGTGDTRVNLSIYDGTALAHRHLVRVTWTGGVPSLATASGSGTIYPVESLANGWYRILFSAAGVVAANSNLFYIYTGNAAATPGTVYAWGAQAEDAAVPSSYIKTEGTTVTRSADGLYFPFTAPPQALTVYVRGVERGNRYHALTPRYVSFVSAAGSAPRFLLYNTAGGNVSVFHDNNVDAAVTAAVGASAGVLGDLLEARGVLRADGAVLAGRSINGATESASAASSTPASGLATAWSGERLYLTGPEVNGIFAFTHVVVAEGEQTMDEMRESYYDSGWLDAWPAGWDAETAENLNLPLLHVFDADFTGRYWGVQISDPDNADGYVDLHRLVIAGAVEPSVNFIGGADIQHESDSTTRYADAGNGIHDERPIRRVTRFTIDQLEDAEAVGVILRAMRKLGAKGQCAVVLRPDATADLLPETSFLAVPRELTRLEYPYATFRRVALAFTEEL